MNMANMANMASFLEESSIIENKIIDFIYTIDFIFTKKQLFDIIRKVVRAFSYSPQYTVSTVTWGDYHPPDTIFDVLLSILFMQIVENIKLFEITSDKYIQIYCESRKFIETNIKASSPNGNSGNSYLFISHYHLQDLRAMFNPYIAPPVYSTIPRRCTQYIKLYNTIYDKIKTHDLQLILLWGNVLLHNKIIHHITIKLTDLNSFLTEMYSSPQPDILHCLNIFIEINRLYPSMTEDENRWLHNVYTKWFTNITEYNVLELTRHTVCDGKKLNRSEYPIASYLSSKLVDKCIIKMNRFPTAIEYITNCIPSAPNLEDVDEVKTSTNMTQL